MKLIITNEGTTEYIAFCENVNEYSELYEVSKGVVALINKDVLLQTLMLLLEKKTKQRVKDGCLLATVDNVNDFLVSLNNIVEGEI